MTPTGRRTVCFVIITVVVIVMVAAAWFIIANHSGEDSPEFRIDDEDLGKISEEESGRTYLLSDRCQLSADMFAEMAVYNDDVDGTQMF